MNALLQEAINLLASSLIRYSPILVIIAILLKKSNKKPNKTPDSLNIIRWIFIIYSILTLLNFAWNYDTAFENEVFRLRVMGPHWWAYWTMMFFGSVFPLILLIKKLGRNQYLLLFISITMSIGYWFELFVIVMSLHRDHI